MEQAKHFILITGMILLAILNLVTLIRAILGPRFTDRVVAVNVINTMVVAMICIVSVMLGEDFLVDVALIYTLLSFLSVVVLSRLVMTRQQKKTQKGQLENREGGSELD
ncbi:hypothetical protein SDC9_149348 [bioreactor metagenome]|uniref:Na(+)/H(+) antiporter subunit F n=1 Tax=bioreactor metagenome TaxID=1076179 RepID=A0A645EJC9_9ZZZZ